MLFGRAVNTWNGLIAAGISTVITIIGATQDADTAKLWATILGAIGIFAGVVIAFIANGTQTVNEGDKLNVVTPEGEPNKTIVITPNS